MPKHLLIADDDTDLARLVGLSARVLWPDCTFDTAADGAGALRYATARRPDVAILDVLMPPPDGLTVCRRLRDEHPLLPILLLTAGDTTLDEVRGLNAGADDYLTKPFDHLKLVAHLRALMRRAEAVTAPGDEGKDALAVGALRVDLEAREVRIDGVLIDLTPTEYLLLETLAKQPGEIVSHRALLERVWGREYVYEIHYLKVFINRLRHKLGDDAVYPRYIETRRSAGYRLIANGAS
jgi:two-component system KDP operon response regulator KdpE